MAIEGGFFNSLEETEDRAYDATQFNDIFEGILEDGILADVSDQLAVRTDGGMTVIVGAGKAWFNNSWIGNDSDFSLPLASSFPTLDRIDLVVLDMDKRDEVRANDIIVLVGTPNVTPVRPEIIVEEDHIQIPIAEVRVDSGILNIDNSNITNLHGSAECPYAAGMMLNLNIEAFTNEWHTQFHNWFSLLQDNLEYVVAGNLQHQIIEIRNHQPGRNLLVNGDMAHLENYNLDIVDPVMVSDHDDYHTSLPSMWRLVTENNATYQPSQFFTTVEVDPGINEIERTWLMIKTTALTMPSSNAKTYIEQVIPYDVLWKHIEKAGKGSNKDEESGDADDLVLTFSFMCGQEGTYIVEIVDEQNERHFVAPYVNTVVNVETPVTIEIPGDQPGLPFRKGAKQHGLRIRFWLYAGTDYKSGVLSSSWEDESDVNRAVSITGITNADITYYLTDVQLTVGSDILDFERESYQDNTARVGRFYEIVVGQGYIVGVENGWGLIRCNYLHDKLDLYGVELSDPGAQWILHDNSNDPPIASVSVYLQEPGFPHSYQLREGDRTFMLRADDPLIVAGGTYFVWYKTVVSSRPD